MKRAGALSGVVAGLALFGMLFGSSNLLLPIKLGTLASGHWGGVLAGFMLTAVLLPLLGMISITLFDGDYQKFFGRLGSWAGMLLALVCIVVVGFLTVTPRIMWQCYAFVHPLIGLKSFSTFAVWYLVLNLLGGWYKHYLVWVLGLVVAPLLLLGLGLVIGGALLTTSTEVAVQGVPLSLSTGALYGFATLDLIGMLLFGCVVLEALKRLMRYEASAYVKRFAIIGLQGGLLCSGLFAVVYTGLTVVGSCYGAGLGDVSDVMLLRAIITQLFGDVGLLWVAVLFFLICYSTSVVLASVTAEYVQVSVCNNRVQYAPVLVAVHVALLLVSYWGLQNVGDLVAGPVAHVLYPVVIMLTLCNLGYALFGLQSVKMPVLVTALVSSIWYVRQLF